MAEKSKEILKNLEEKENFTRLNRLLEEKGTEALRNQFDAKHSPVDLPAVLNTNRDSLLKLKFNVINGRQWDLLFPPSGNPPSTKTFDITLLTVLLQNICSLPPPTTGWTAMPPVTDSSLQANVTRMKILRNEIYDHVFTEQIDNTTFRNLWERISVLLTVLGIPEEDVRYLRSCRLDTEEGNTEKRNKEEKQEIGNSKLFRSCSRDRSFVRSLKNIQGFLF